MTPVPRRVQVVPDREDSPHENPIQDLEKFRNKAAWVLLGEPGAGKTESLKTEAAESNGEYLPIANFIVADLDPKWQGKTLFLDGLDEIRASGGQDSTLQLLRRQLKRLGSPPFRIACRAADWYGSTDRDNLKTVSPDGDIAVLLLEPLGPDDVLTILRDNHKIADPQAFVDKARNRGVADLLDNPQTLGMLAQAIRGDDWPSTRAETYQFACEYLVEEANKRHRDRERGQPRSTEKLLDAAGQICAVLLLSDKAGIALDAERANSRFVTLDDCAPPDIEAASQAARSKLFRAESEERVVPSHRSIAEYLAARWLARRVDAEGLPLGRVLNLLLGRDGRTVAGLRGLYGWLALHCRAARPRLIETDPLTAIVYGDVKPMTVEEKRLILVGLRREAERFTAFLGHASAAHAFGALVDARMRKDFLAILNAPGRDDASQALANCVLDILAYGERQPDLAGDTLAIVRDDTRWPAVRKTALNAWLEMASDTHAELALLNDVSEGRVTDRDDELAGKLLRRLYPMHLGPEALLRHLHPPKDPHLIGYYYMFWVRELPKRAPEEHLPILLDGLVNRPEFRSHDPYEHRLNRMVDVLLARGITTHGDDIMDERLFTWLGIGADEYGHIRREESAKQTISLWLGTRHERYKALLALCFNECKNHEHPRYCVHKLAIRLDGATPPDDIGLWHLQQASLNGSDELATTHLAEAMSALRMGHGAPRLSLEQLEAWGAAHPERKHLLEPLLFCDLSEWQIEMAAEKAAYTHKRVAARRDRTIAATRHLPAIRDGTARADLMHSLAGVWANRYSDVHGETPAERFDIYCENGNELLAAAEAGFRLCPERTDLPTIEEIIDLSIKQREHFVRLPCLVGMELRWRDGSGEIERLFEDILRRMIAFRLTYGVDETPEWFVYLVQYRSRLVAEVLIAYASAMLKAGKEYVDSIYVLEHDPKYRDVAIIAAPRLLAAFPVRASTGQLHYLENLLKAALRSARDDLVGIAKKKLRLKAMDSAQRVYWYAVAMLLDPTGAETALWRYVGKSETRANTLSGFLCDRDGDLVAEYELSARTIGRLVEMIAPHAQTEWPRGGGAVTDAMRRGDQLRTMITRLGAMTTPEAAIEIDRLLQLPVLQKLKYAIEGARHQQKLRQRESEFRFLPPREVAQVLANKAPASTADLAALALDHLDGIGTEVRQDNDDGFRAFWNIKNKSPISQRDETDCRDALLTRLRARLSPIGIDCQPEGDYAKDNKADLRLSYGNHFELPIEIKRDSNPHLWTNLRSQLIEKYTIAPRANGHGVYLVLWFGGMGMPGAKDGGKKPQTPKELQERLEAWLDSSERGRIFVRVLDVSWPS